MTQIYVPLHNHTHGSLLDGYSTEKELVKRCHDIGAKACGITDHGTCSIHYYFEDNANSYGIKPILGIEAYFVDDVEKSKERKDKPSNFSHACLWAINNEGLENLWALSTISNDPDHFYHKPRMDWKLLRQYSKGLAVSDGCLLAEVARAVNDDDFERAERYLLTLIDVFGKENVFVELHTWQFIDPKTDDQKHLNEEMSKANQGKLKLAKKLGLKTIAVNDAHYSNREDYVFHELVWASNTHKGSVTMSDALSDDGESLGRGETAAWVMTDDEIRKYLGLHGIPASDIEEAIQNTSDFADRCSAKLTIEPHFPFISGDSDKDLEMFNNTIEEGFVRKVPKGKEDEYRDRVNMEKDIIIEKHFHGYFNTVSDYMRYTKSDDKLGLGGIPGKEETFGGVARGSGGGSLVSYLMDITELDPIKHNLPFERFLSRSRGVDDGYRLYFEHDGKDPMLIDVKQGSKEAKVEEGELLDGRRIFKKQKRFVGDFPDIDSDFPSSFSDTIVEYLKHRYGKNNVAKVGTFQKSQAKIVFKDLARANGIDFQTANAISRLFPEDIGPQYFETEDSLNELYEHEPALKEYEEEISKVAPHLSKMVGRIRQCGIHASGYIISKDSLIGKLPMRYRDGELVTQFDLTCCSELGFIKYDLLKIKALDIIDNAVRSAISGGKVVKKVIDGKETFRNIKEVDLKDGWEEVTEFSTDMIYTGATNDLYDPEIWAPVEDGDTLGLFQMETKSGTSVARRMKIKNVDDAAVMSAVNRPGMIRAGLVGTFFDRKNGKVPVTYPHPMLERIVGNTFGFFIFQEQVMNLFVVCADYTLEESDKVRKIVTKKQYDLMIKLYTDFVRACKANPKFVEQLPSKYKTVDDCCKDIWEMVEYTVSYSFNSSHSYAYAYLSGWQAWLKTHFLTEFIKASITYDPAKIRLYYAYAKKHGIRIMSPDISKSNRGFTIEGKNIRTPLSQISGVGWKAEEEIILNQPYGSVEDFEEKTSGRNAKRVNVYRNLILAGAFDSIDKDREKLLSDIYIRKGKVKAEGEKIVADVDIDLSTRAKQSKEEEAVLGISLSFDPMSEMDNVLKAPAYSDIDDINEFDVNKSFAIYGRVTEIKRHRSKSGTMAWVSLELRDLEPLQITMFSEMFANVKHLFEEGDVVLCSVTRGSDFRGQKSFIVKQLMNMTTYLS